MKKLLLIALAMMLGSAVFAGEIQKGRAHRVSTGPNEGFIAMTKGGNVNTDVLQSWVLPFDGGYSGNTRAPGNTFRYQRTMYLITPAEMAASGFPSGQLIQGIGFQVYSAGGTSQTGNFKIYLMNTSDNTYQLGSSWTTAGFTMVSDIAAFAVPIAVGPYTVNFSGGSPFTYTGGGVYVAWEFSNPSPGTLGTTALNISCNYLGLPNSLYGQRNNTTMPTSLVVSAFRPATLFINNDITDILAVTNIYTREKCPVPFGVPNTISVRIQNVDANTANFDLTVTVNSTPPFSGTLPGITLAGGTAGVFDIPGWNPSTLENVTVTATVAPAMGETWLSNNTLAIPVQVNNNLFSYNFANVPNSSIGMNYPGSGIFANKYHMNGTGLVIGGNFFIYSDPEPYSSVGESVYAVVMNGAGTILAQSAPLVLTEANVNMMNALTFDTPPQLTDEDFYIGLVQPAGAAQYYPMGYVNENPGRLGISYYWSGTAGGAPAADINTLNFNAKFMAEAMVSPLAPPIPTLSEWGLIILGLALLGFGSYYLLRMKS